MHSGCLPSGETQYVCEMCKEALENRPPNRRRVQVTLPREAAGVAPIKTRGRRRAEGPMELTTAQARRLSARRAVVRRVYWALQRWLRVLRLRRLACELASDEHILALRSNPQRAGRAWLQRLLAAELKTRRWLAEAEAEAEAAEQNAAGPENAPSGSATRRKRGRPRPFFTPGAAHRDGGQEEHHRSGAAVAA